MAKKRHCFPAEALLNGAGLLRGAEALRRRGRAAAGRSGPALARSRLRRGVPAAQDLLRPARDRHRHPAVRIGAAHRKPLSRHDSRGGARRHHRRLRHAVLAGHGLRLPADRQRAVRALATGPQLRLSLVIAPWALLLLFYFLRRLGKQGETIGQIAGVVTAAVAVLRYEDLNDWAVRLLGTGSQAEILRPLRCRVGRPGCAVVALAEALRPGWRRRSQDVAGAAPSFSAGDGACDSPRNSGNTAADTAGDRRCSPSTKPRMAR